MSSVNATAYSGHERSLDPSGDGALGNRPTLSRRKFIKTALAASALSAASFGPRIFPTAPIFEKKMSGISGVVVDNLYPQSTRFGQRFGSHGIATHAFLGDITSLWTRELSSLMASAPVSIAGLTSDVTLFGIEQICTQYHMRIKYRVNEPDGTLKDMRGVERDWLHAGGSAGMQNDDEFSWVDKVADAMLSRQQGCRPSVAASAPYVLPLHDLATRRPQLVAWLIEPMTSS